MKSKTLIQDFTQGSVFRLLLTFSIPLMGANLLQTVYAMVDMIVIGQFVGSVGMSAVAIGGDILHLLTLTVMGLGGAGQVLVSQYIGAGQRDRVRAAIGTLFTVTILFTAVLSLGALLFLDPILAAMNTPPEAMAQARAYTLVCLCGMVFICGYNLVSSILRGMGDSRHPLIFIAIASIINLVLDLLFVAGLGMDALGAALATVIGQGVSFAWAIIFLYRRRESFCFDFKPRSFRPSKIVLLPIIKLGIPLCLQFVAINFSILFVNSFINEYGVIASAVSGVGTKLFSVASVVINALNTAGSTMVGQNLGAGEYPRVPRIIFSALAIDMVVAAVLSAVTALFPKVVFGLFNSEPEVLAMAVTYVPISVLSFIGYGLRSPFFALINGSGNARLNLTVGLLDGIVARIGLALLLGITAGMGIYGFWYGSAFAGFVPFPIGLAYYFSGRWKAAPKAVQA